MQVFKTFLKLSVRNIASGIMYLVIFLILALTLAKNSTNSGDKIFSAEKIKIAVFDKDNTELSKSLYNYLDDTQKIQDITNDEEKWPDELFYHSAELIVIINDGFEKNVEAGNYADVITTYDNPDSNKSYIIKNQINTYISNISNFVNSGYTFAEASDKAAEITSLNADTTYLDPANVKPMTAISRFYTYLPYVMICILINSLGPVIIIWNRPGIKARTNVSALPFAKKNGALIGATAAYAGIIFGIFLVVSFIFFKEDAFNQQAIYYYLNAFMYLLVTLSLTFLVAQLSKKVTMLAMFSNVIGLSTSFLCGVFVLRSLLPDKVVAFSKCLPTYWYINVTEELTTSTGGLSSLAVKSMFIQVLFALAFLVIALVIMKARRQKAE